MTTAPFDPDAPLPDLHIPVRGLGIETTARYLQKVEYAMSENVNTEIIPAEHDEDICSSGVTMCQECYACAADSAESAK